MTVTHLHQANENQNSANAETNLEAGTVKCLVLARLAHHF